MRKRQNQVPSSLQIQTDGADRIPPRKATANSEGDSNWSQKKVQVRYRTTVTPWGLRREIIYELDGEIMSRIVYL